MTRRNVISCLLLVCFIVTGCADNVVTRPSVFLDAESYTSGGLDAFSEAKWNRAQLLFTQALSLYQGIDDQQGILYSQINLAEVALSRRNYSTVERHLGLAADIAKKEALQHYQERISLLYALNALQQNQTDEAESVLQVLLPEFDEDRLITIPDTIQMAAIANRTKIAFVQKQDESLWTLRYANALRLSTKNNPVLEARLLRFQGSLMLGQENYQKAESGFQQALSMYKKNVSRPGIAATLSELGALYMIQGHWQNALDYLNRSIAVFRYLGDICQVIGITGNLVIVEAELGNLERSNKLKQWLVDMKDKQSVQCLQ